jgi:5-formyltetrahydrofolate cyclo-ligase
MKSGFGNKDEIRRYVWDKMAELGIAVFPLPPHNRIPNFIGADLAAKRLLELDDYHSAKVIKVNPDSPQRPFREYALRDGKILVMATPRLRKGFLILEPKYVRGRERYASTIKGAFQYGSIVQVERIPTVDLIVEGSVAVSYDGGRLGKGEGYAEIEFAILRECDIVEKNVPIYTSVHDIQVFKSLPKDVFDVSINIISTPKRIIQCRGYYNRPEGIYWDLLDEDKIKAIPLLEIIKKRSV